MHIGLVWNRAPRRRRRHEQRSYESPHHQFTYVVVALAAMPEHVPACIMSASVAIIVICIALLMLSFALFGSALSRPSRLLNRLLSLCFAAAETLSSLHRGSDRRSASRGVEGNACTNSVKISYLIISVFRSPPTPPFLANIKTICNISGKRQNETGNTSRSQNLLPAHATCR